MNKEGLVALYLSTKDAGFISLHRLTNVAVTEGVLFAYRDIEGEEMAVYGYPLTNVLGFSVEEQKTAH